MRGSMPNFTKSWLKVLPEAMQGSRSVPCHSAVSDTLAGVVGVPCLETSAAAPETDAAAAQRTPEHMLTEDVSRQAGALDQSSPKKAEESVNFWPDVDNAAAVDGEVEQDADDRGSLLPGSEHDEAEAPAEQQEQPHYDEHANADALLEEQMLAHDDAERAEQTSPEANQHVLIEEHQADELPEEASQHSPTVDHVHAEPEEAGLAGEHATEEPEEASHHGSEEDDRLAELMGAVPTINLRELRTQVASLPEILSRAERTAELCARGSAPGLPGLQGLSPHKLADGSIHSWVAQSRATAIMMQRDEHVPRHHHSFCTAAAQLRHSHGEAQRDGPAHEEERGSRGEGSAAGSPDSPQPDARRRLTAKRSLAEVRAAIGIVPNPETAATGYDTFQEPATCANPATYCVEAPVCMCPALADVGLLGQCFLSCDWGEIVGLSLHAHHSCCFIAGMPLSQQRRRRKGRLAKTFQRQRPVQSHRP